QSTEQTTVLRGRGFVGGYSYYNRDGQVELVEAVRETDGEVEIVDADASGFARGFTNDVDLVDDESFVFVADSDGDLDTFETFDPLSQDVLIRIVVTSAVRDSDGKILELEMATATTVGDDTVAPEVLGYTTLPQIIPGNGQSGVDPQEVV